MGGCTFKKDSFSNFQIYKILYILAIVLLAIVLLAIDMMYIISPGLIYLISVSLTTFTRFFQPYSPPPDARNHKFDLFLISIFFYIEVFVFVLICVSVF